jgi:beta-lactamase regulating signal transducer with metallopeptidase domain
MAIPTPVSNDSATTVKDKVFAWISRTEQFLPYLSIAYLLLLLFLSIKWLQAYKYTRDIKSKGLSKISVDWRLFVQTLSEQLGIRRPVKIYLSAIVRTPLTIGFIKPIILIPLASINHLTAEQMEAVILHELAHIRRLDYLVNLLVSVVEAIMFFNPFMQLLSKHIKRERENCCDDWVLQYEYNATAYAKALLQIAMFQGPTTSFAMNATENKEVLLTRVKRIIEKSERKFHYRHQLIALLFITTILSSVAWLSPKNKLTASNSPTPATKVIAEPLAAKIENPLFNPVFFLADNDQEKMEQEMERQIERAERHNHKTVRLSRLPLAIPQKKRNLSLEEIAAPVISNPVQITKSKLPVSPRVIFNIDTTLLKRIFSTKWLVEIEKTEKDVKGKLAKALAKNAEEQQSTYNQKAISEMRTALSQIKATKLKMLKVDPKALTTRVYTRSNSPSYQQALVNELKSYEQQDEDMHALAEEINKVLQEVQLHFYANLKPAESITQQVPAVFYTRPENHSFSYEFTEKPRVRILSKISSTTNTQSSCAEAEKGIGASAISTSEKTREKVACPVSPAPCSPVPRASNTVKKARPIIHI